MNEAPYHCPICNYVLTHYGDTTTETATGQYSHTKSHRCTHNHYACSELDPNKSYLGASFSEIFVFGDNEQMFQTGCIALRVFYLNDKYLTHQIDLHYKHKLPFKIGLKLNDEIFQAVFSRDNLHPLLEKLEKYEVFS